MGGGRTRGERERREEREGREQEALSEYAGSHAGMIPPCPPGGTRFAQSDVMSAKPPRRERQYDPDRELVRSFGVGCAVVFALFLCGWVVIALFWLG